MDLNALVSNLQSLDKDLKAHVSQTANVGLTVRNWLVGAYLVEYEQNGKDRAKYGENLIKEVAKHISIKGLTKDRLWRCRQFYSAYPEILATLSQEFPNLLSANNLPILATVSRESEFDENIPRIEPAKLLTSLSFSHFVELIKIEDSLQRRFYELESIRSNWSVRELKRQMGSLLFERTGLSNDKEKLIRITNQSSDVMRPSDIIRDPYVFEFLGLPSREVITENELEHQLLDHLQTFLLELGHGFCFEDRQKNIKIGSTDYFIDLVFYHRKLHCNILIELKTESFNHSNAGQLNTYLNYFKKHEMSEGDNPPIGLLLCTNKDQPLVEYALGGMDENLFVSTYKVALPRREELEHFLISQTSF